MNPITMKLVVDDLILQALREDITFEDVSTASAVSYTHLDVYKRQPSSKRTKKGQVYFGR